MLKAGICVAVGLTAAIALAAPGQNVLAKSPGPGIPPAQWGHAIAMPARHAAGAAVRKPTPVNRGPLSRDQAALDRAKATADGKAAASSSTSTSAPAPLKPYSVFNATNFPGLATTGTGSPSDSTGDVSPNNYIEMDNSQIGVRPARTSGSFTVMDLATFGGANATDCTFDPQIAWDQQAGRWLYSFLDQVPTATSCASIATDYIAFGWSKTSDPTDLLNGWCFFGINTTPYLFDYDKLGHDNSFLTIGANVFDNSGLSGSNFVTSVIVAITKPANGVTTCAAPALSGFGSPTSPLTNADGSVAWTPVPASTTDSSTVGYVVAGHYAVPGAQTKVMVWHLSQSISGPVLNSDGDVTVNSFNVPPSVPQPITTTSCSAGNCLDTLDGRLTQAVARFDPSAGAETVWTQHAISDPAISSGARSVERWYELNPGQGTPRQAGDVSDSSLHVFNGAISPTGAGNEAVIFYNAGNNSNLVSMRAQSRNSSTTLGMVTNETVIATSTVSDVDGSCGFNQPTPNGLPCRWGDYSAARPDPIDTNVVWGTNMLTGTGGTSTTSGWSTQVAAFSPGCDVTTVTPNTGSLVAGTIQQFTAAATGCSNPEFAFFLQDPMGNWTLKQGFSSSNTWTWDTAGYAAGAYNIHVWGNQAGDSRANWESLGSSAIGVTMSPPCSSAGVTPANPSTPAGSTITLTATSTACQIPIYAFFVQDPSGTWTLKRPFDTNPAYAWDTTGLGLGTYTFHVWAKQRGDSAAYEAIASDTVTLTGCTSASISPATAAQPVASTVNLTASAVGCPNPQFEFFVQYPDMSWHLKQVWGGATFAWDTTGLAPGTYTVHAWANQQGASTATFEAVGSATVALNICTGASISPASPSAPAGSVVALTASSTGCTTPQYEFFVQYPDMTWHLKQAWSSSAAFNWDSSGLAPGLYTVHAWANDLGDSTASPEAIGSSTVTLTGCTSANASPNMASPQTIGTTVIFTASSIGCPNPLYEFFLLDPAGVWHLVQPFGMPTTWTWNTSGLAAGTYTIHVWANQSGADMSRFEANGGPTYNLTAPPPCASAGLAPSTTSQPAGSSFILTASSSGCTNPQYEFFVQYPDGSWNLKQGFSGAVTFNFDTTGLAPGPYTVHVWASATGAGHDSIGSAAVTLTGCTSASISPTNPSAAAGSMVALTGSAMGCPSPQFEFFVQYPNGTWNLKRAWAASATFSWDTTGLAPGVYTIHAWANNQGASTATFETFGSDTVTLTGCTSAALSPSSGSAPVGTVVNFTASSMGCPNPVYEFFIQYPNGTWNLVQNFGSAMLQWNTAGLPKGNYVIHVWANNQGADTSTHETIGSATYTLT